MSSSLLSSHSHPLAALNSSTMAPMMMTSGHSGAFGDLSHILMPAVRPLRGGAVKGSGASRRTSTMGSAGGLVANSNSSLSSGMHVLEAGGMPPRPSPLVSSGEAALPSRGIGERWAQLRASVAGMADRAAAAGGSQHRSEDSQQLHMMTTPSRMGSNNAESSDGPAGADLDFRSRGSASIHCRATDLAPSGSGRLAVLPKEAMSLQELLQAAMSSIGGSRQSILPRRHPDSPPTIPGEDQSSAPSSDWRACIPPSPPRVPGNISGKHRRGSSGDQSFKGRWSGGGGGGGTHPRDGGSEGSDALAGLMTDVVPMASEYRQPLIPVDTDSSSTSREEPLVRGEFAMNVDLNFIITMTSRLSAVAESERGIASQVRTDLYLSIFLHNIYRHSAS